MEGSGGDAKVGELTLRLGLRDFEVAALDHWVIEDNWAIGALHHCITGSLDKWITG